MALANLQDIEPSLESRIGNLTDSQEEISLLYNLSDAELVIGAREGDNNYFTVLWDRYEHLMYSLAYSITKSREVAEDILQDAAFKFYSKLSSIRKPEQVDHFLGSIVRNTALDYLKRQRARNESPMEITDPVSEPNPLDKLLAMELRGIFKLAVENLPTNAREIFQARYFKGKKIKKIAEDREISEGTVKAALNSARKALGKYQRANGYDIQDINEMHKGCLTNLFQ